MGTKSSTAARAMEATMVRWWAFTSACAIKANTMTQSGRCSRLAMKLFVLSALFALSVGAENTAGDGPRRPNFAHSRLQYYVHVQLGEPGLAPNLFPALNPNLTGSFGHGQLFALNATRAPERNSTRVGYVRGFALDSSYTAGQVDLIEVALISYDDGVYKGTIQIQGEILDNPETPNEVAIMGGTGSFRGARGYGFISLLNTTDPLFHHDLHFLHNL